MREENRREETFPPLSPLTLERYRLRELPPAELARLDARLARDPDLRAALARLEASDLETLKALPPEDFLRRLETRAEARARREKVFAENAASSGREESKARGSKAKGSAFSWKPALAGFAALALVALPTWLATGTGSGPEGSSVERLGEESVRIKGLEPRLAIYRKTMQGAEPLEPGAKAHAGEFLRIGYQAGGFSYGAIVSVDGNGSVTRHWPEEGHAAGKLEKGEALLPHAFELDAAPDYERFYFVVSRRAFDLDPVLSDLERGENSPRADASAKIIRFEILKDTGI